MRFPARCAAIAALASLMAAPAFAASFDCSKARTADEVAICANPALSDLDVEMATLYRVRMEIPMLMGSRAAAQDEQRNWLAGRRACGGSLACLTRSYEQRIAALNKTIGQAMYDYCKLQDICG